MCHLYTTRFYNNAQHFKTSFELHHGLMRKRMIDCAIINLISQVLHLKISLQEGGGREEEGWL